MQRRTFLHSVLAAGALGAPAWHPTRAHALDRDRSFLLSRQGCGRATGYAESNKIVTVGDKTHVAWLDSPPEGFRVRVRTVDRRTGTWSPVYTVGTAHDNHGGPAMTVDNEGYLHLVYYPHHHSFRYRKSVRPNDASQWEEEVQFGERCTYPTLVCGPDNTLYFTCRRSFADRPWQVELWTKGPGQSWQGPRPILRSRYGGYSHFLESLAWGPDHKTLHLCCRFHENSSGGAYGRVQTVGYLTSRDFGDSWTRSDGTPVETPATAETVEVLASGGVDQQRILRVGQLGVDSHNTPHLLYSVQEQGTGQTILASRDDGRWQRTTMNLFLPEAWRSWQLIMPGAVVFDGQDAMTIVASVQNPEDLDKSWGHPTNEIVRFRTHADHTFISETVSEANPSRSNWLPNVERPTGFNQLPDHPGLLYTAGPPGEKNTDLLSNDVYYWQ